MTRTEILDRLALYRQAETRILQGGQSYTIGSITYSRANLAALQDEIHRLQNELAQADMALHGGPFQHSHAIFGGRR